MSNVELKLKDTIYDNDIYDIYIDDVYAGGLEANYDPRINSFYIENIKKSDDYKAGHLLEDVVNYLYNDKGYDLGCLPLEKYRGYYEELGFTPFIYNDNDVYYHKMHKGDSMKTDEFLNKVKNIINEDNMSELKKELDYLYKGIGWAEWDYFKEGLAYSTNFKPEETTDEDLEKMINSSGIAKVEQVKDIKNYSDMEDFDPKDFNPDDKIILTKKPMSNQFYNENLDYNDGDSFYHSRFGRLTYNANNDTFEDTDGDSYDADMIDPEELESINGGMSNRFCRESSQKNEASMPLSDYKELYRMLGIFKKDVEEEYPGDSSDMMYYWNVIGEIQSLIKDMWDGEIIAVSFAPQRIHLPKKGYVTTICIVHETVKSSFRGRFIYPPPILDQEYN